MREGCEELRVAVKETKKLKARFGLDFGIQEVNRS